MIGLINYGMGNLHSVAKALEKVGGDVELVEDAEALARYERIVLPGVGAFRDCIGALQKNGMDEALQSAIAGGTPFWASVWACRCSWMSPMNSATTGGWV